NLYISSTGVFPTASHAGPTMTAVAVATRLADHLRRRLVAGTGAVIDHTRPRREEGPAS
ncbi:GMC family oxidoreductase, partial [Bacillus nitratireducens]|nr:GMC family oxidoreductase [Bacillus nitratireducens]